MSAADKARQVVQDLTGMWWPAGDEGDLRTAAHAWRTFADAVDDLTGATNTAARSLIENNRGQSIDAFEEFWSRYHRGGRGWLKDLADSSRSMADALDKYADAVAGAKKKLEHELEIVGATLVAGTALAFFTAGISEGVAAGAAAGIVELAGTLGVSVSTEVATIAGTTLATAAMGGIESVTVDLAVTQPVSIATGEAKGFNLDEAVQAGTTGALLGGALGGAGATAGAAADAGGLRNLRLTGLDGLEPPSAGRIRPPEAELPAGGRPTEAIECVGDPVDVVTGAMVLPQTDFTLPGQLPLVFERAHLSSYRAGEWFGPSWASTLDERLQLDEQGVVFAAADGMRLVYPVPPTDGSPVLPRCGPRWPLAWDGQLGGVMTISDPATGTVRGFSRPETTGVRHVLDLPLESVEDRHGHRIEFDRTPEGVPLAIHHSGGYHVTVETTGQRVTALRLGDDLLMSYGYDADGNLTEVVNSSGLPMRFTYDKDGRITSWTDRNEASYQYAYDDRGRVVAGSGTGGFLSVQLEYDEDDRTTTAIDAQGNRRVYQYDANCKVVAETDPLGNTTHTEWDARGERRLAVTDPLGRTTRHTYDDAGNLTTAVLADGSTTHIGYNELNLPAQIKEPGGATWRHTYDERGNLLTTTDPTGAETRYAYDAAGHLSTITDALGNTRHITCNPAGLPVSLTDPSGATTHVERDAFGRIVTITDPLGRTTRMDWTAEGKPAWREEPDGTRQTWTWDPEGNLLAHTDPAGNTTHTTTGPFNVPVSRTDPDGTTYAFAYDTEMRLTEVTNPLGWKWTYTYDAAGRLTSETDFNGRTVTYERDAAGQLTARTNGAGETIRFTRDELGRTLRQGEDTTFEYDLAGHLIRAAGPDATVEWQRDLMGRVLAESTDGRTVSYGYDALGHRIHRTTPSGTTSTWTFDPAGRPSALDTSHGALAFAYDAAGRETERRLGPDLALTQTWDTADRLTSQTLTTRGQRILQHRAYAYRIDGHLQEIRDLASGTQRLTHDRTGRITEVRAHGWTESYVYDAAGNLTSATAPGDDFPTGDRAFSGTLITSADRTTYEHDTQGRLTRKTHKLLNGQARSWTYEWTPDDRLAAVTTPDGHHWRYAYDPLGRRTAKRRLAPDGSAAEEVTYSWDATTLAEQTASDGTTITWDCAPGTHAPLAQTTQDAHGAHFHAVVTDLVGTPTELVSPDGEIAWQRRTTLWGAPLPAPEAKARNLSCPLRFAGQYQDDETGLHYNYFRYYDPETARYISPDPLGLEPAPNHYGYVGNPLQATDALGLKGSKLCRVDVTWSGRVTYGELDALGRPTRMTARIERDMLDEGTDAKRSIRPPGFKGGMPIGNHARGHLLANRLGGSGDIPENLVTLVQDPVNTPIMRGFESQVYDAVAKGETVNYTVTPVYDGANAMPRGVTLEARGSGGFHLSVSLPNREP